MPHPAKRNSSNQELASFEVSDGVSLWILSVVLLLLAPGLITTLYGLLRGLSSEEFKSDPLVKLALILSIFVAHLVTIWFAWLTVKKRSKLGPLESLGWKWNGVGPWTCLGITIAFLTIASLASELFPDPDNDFAKLLRSSDMVRYSIAFVAVATAPIVEEIVYRGVLFSSLKSRFGSRFAISAVTLLFALVHLPQYWPSYTTISIIVSLSLFLTVIRNWTNSLLPPFFIHLLFNGFQSVGLILNPESLKEPEKLTSMFLQ